MTADRHGQWSSYRCIRNALSDGMRHEVLKRRAHPRVARTSLRGTDVVNVSSYGASHGGQKHMTDLASNAGKAVSAFRKQRATLDQREADAANAFASGHLPLGSYQVVCRRLHATRQTLAMRCGSSGLSSGGTPLVLARKVIEVT